MMLLNSDRIDERSSGFQRSAKLSPLVEGFLVDTLAGLGRFEHAEAPLRAQVRNGYWPAVDDLADLLERLGRISESEALLRVHLEETPESRTLCPNEPHRIRLLADLLTRAGRTTEADQLRQYGIEPDGSTATPWESPPPAR
jgi:hypothetical protein